MPKRKLPKPSNAALIAIKEARTRGVELTAEEEQAFFEFRKGVRSAAEASAPEVIAVDNRDGVLRFKYRGQTGPGTTQHPRGIEAARRERDFLTEVSKLLRRPPTSQAVAARRSRADQSSEQISSLLEKYAYLGRSAAKAVAAELGVSPEHVRRVRNRLAKQT